MKTALLASFEKDAALAGLGKALAAAGWLSIPAAFVALVVKLAVAGAGLALLEIVSAKLRIFRAPEFLGTAFLLATLGMLTHFLLEAVGWRGTYLVYAALLVLVCAPLHAFALPRTRAIIEIKSGASAATPPAHLAPHGAAFRDHPAGTSVSSKHNAMTIP